MLSVVQVEVRQTPLEPAVLLAVVVETIAKQAVLQTQLEWDFRVVLAVQMVLLVQVAVAAVLAVQVLLVQVLLLAVQVFRLQLLLAVRSLTALVAVVVVVEAAVRVVQV